MEAERLSPPSYPASKAAATLVHPHFARHLGAVPDVETIAAMLDTAFWASLRREEGYTPRISLAFVAPGEVTRPLRLERPIPLAPESLTRVSPAVVRPGIHLGVFREQEELWVWGATRHLPPFTLVLEVVAPGLLVIKHSRGEESGKFVNIAVIEGDRVKIIDERAARFPDCPALLYSLLGMDSQFAADGSLSVLIQLAVSMREHGRGGLLLVVPANGREWRESILQPVTYSVVPPFTALSELAQADPPGALSSHWQDAMRRAVDGIGGLTAVDGATIITERYELLAFGAKIVRRPGWAQVSRVKVTEPIAGTSAETVEPAQLGGTRHLSAAQFAHDQRDCIALVASQDGRFSVLAWSSCEEMVQAHRIESLLL
jgi:hypothetical protein